MRQGRAASNSSGNDQADPTEDYAEQAVLSAMLRDNAVIGNVLEGLRVEHFYRDAHQKIARAIIELHRQGTPADLVTVADWLFRKRQLDDVGYLYLGNLWDAAPSSANALYYAGIVRERAMGRDYLRTIQKIAHAGHCNGVPPAELLANAQRELAALAECNSQAGAKSGCLGWDEIDAGDLAASDDAPHLDYLPLLGQDGYLVRGRSHMIAGYPRTGKTELITACCHDWLAMGERILYFTEEPRSIWRCRLARARAGWSGMQLVFALGAEPLEMLQRMRDGQESIIVIDALRNLGLILRDECDNLELAQRLNPWIAAARLKNKSILFAHHMRKGAGEHGEGIAGGHAFLGCVDIAIELRHDMAPGRRLIRAYARLIQPAELMYERQQDGTMKALGTPESVSLVEVRRGVLEALDGDWCKTADVRERLEEPKPSASQVRRALQEEAETGAVERDPPLTEKAERKTVRWRRAEQP